MTSPVRAPRATPRGLVALPAPEVRPDLRVVRAPARRSRTGLWFGLSVVLVFGALFVAAMAHSLLVSGQAHLDAVNGRIRTEQEALQRDQLRLAQLQSPARIAAEADARGMVDSGSQTWWSPDAGAQPVETGGTGTGSADGTGTGTDPSGGTGQQPGSELASGTDGTATQP